MTGSARGGLVGRMGIRGRVIAALAVLAVVFLAIVIRRDERVILVDAAGAFYASCATSMAAMIPEAVSESDTSVLDRQVRMAADGPGVRYAAVVRSPNEVLSSSGDLPDSGGWAAHPVVARIGGAEIRSDREFLESPEFVVLAPTATPRAGGGGPLLVVLGVSREDLARRLVGERRWRWAGLLLVVAGAAAVAFWADRHVRRSTRQLLDGTRAIAGGDLGRRVRITTGDELEKVGANFNAMADRIERSERGLREVNESLERRVAERTAEVVQQRERAAAAEKMAAVGALAAGVAHEINNPLAAIGAMSEDLRDVLEGSGAQTGLARERLGAIGAEVERCRKIVADLLGLARRSVEARTEVRVANLLRHVARVAEDAHKGRDVRLAVDVDAGLVASLPRDAVQQILLNLVSNAIEASPPRGTVRVGALRVGSAIVLSVDDEGTGIAPEAAALLFEPFFTTKAPGEGTGLGLAIVQRIVADLGGTVSAKNRTRGAQFVVEIPTQDRPS